MAGIVFMVLLLICLLMIMVIYFIITSKVKKISREIFGTEDIIKGFKEAEIQSYNTPLSISGGTPIYLPMIQKDFPDFHQVTMEEKIKQFMFGYLNCLENKEIKNISNQALTKTVLEVISSQVSDLTDAKKIEIYDDIKIHKIAISNYVKTKELATVSYQIALEYLNEVKKVQTKYEVDLTYLFQDLDVDSYSLRCGNCGGDLVENSLSCEYCGTIIVRNITKVWVVSDFRNKGRK